MSWAKAHQAWRFSRGLTQPAKVKYIRELELPEVVILDFLSDDLHPQVKKRDGPRNESEVRVRAASQLLQLPVSRRPRHRRIRRGSARPTNAVAQREAQRRRHLRAIGARTAPEYKPANAPRSVPARFHDETGHAKCDYYSVRVAAVLALAAALLAPAPAGPTMLLSAKEPNCSTEGDRLADQGQFTEAVIRYKRAMEELLPGLRKIPFKHEVKRDVTKRENMKALILKEFDEDMTPEEFRANELAMKVFGLLPRDFNLKDVLAQVYSEEVAAFYDPKTKTMHLIEEPKTAVKTASDIARADLWQERRLRQGRKQDGDRP